MGSSGAMPTLHPSHPAGSWQWRLYDEKYIRDENFYDAKNPQGWLLGVKDYLAGRTHDIEGFIDWVEAQTEIIDETRLWHGMSSMMDQDPRTVSRQLWALLAALVKNNAEVHLIFRNVPRHNSADAWRRITEPISEGRELRQAQFLDGF